MYMYISPHIGNGVLVLTTTDVDKTGASYYGEQALYYLSVKGDGNMVPLGKRGEDIKKHMYIHTYIHISIHT